MKFLNCFNNFLITENYDIFAWGRGFEGQLGIKQDSSSVPMHLNYFYKGYKEKGGDVKIKIVDINCGANHSMCLDENG
jgi:alpha-tubulin suppressor-like RCC1 family protein